MQQQQRRLGVKGVKKLSQSITGVDVTEVGEQTPSNCLVADNEDIFLSLEFHDNGFKTGNEVRVGLQNATE